MKDKILCFGLLCALGVFCFMAHYNPGKPAKGGAQRLDRGPGVIIGDVERVVF